MDFLGSWRRKRAKNNDLEESTVLFEEEEGLLGGGRSPRTSPPLATLSTNPAKERLTRTRLLVIIAVLCVCLAGVVYYRTHGSPIVLAGLVSLKAPGCFNDFRGKPLLKSPVTKKYKESVVPDQKYLTSFPSGTFSSQVMSSMHLLQAAQTSRRVAVLPPFQPTHNMSTSGFIPFSEVFDMPRLSRLMNLPIIEWQDIKNAQHWNRWTGATIASPLPYQDGYYGGTLEGIGCWSLSMTQFPDGRPAVEGYVPKALSLDVSWTPLPFENFVIDSNITNLINIYFVSSLGFSYARDNAIQKTKDNYIEKVKQNRKGKMEELVGLEIPTPSHNLRSRLDPDDQMLCFDSLANTATHSREETTSEYSPTWNQIGRQLHFSSHLKEITSNIVQASIGHSKPAGSTDQAQEPTFPAYIAVDIRRHELEGDCHAQGISGDKCHSPISMYSQQVEMLKEGLSSSHSSLPIIIVSDEPYITPQYYKDNFGIANGTSEGFWSNLSETGWMTINHTQLDTVGKYGGWYPTLIDECILAYATAFVGTSNSTSSQLASNRVKTWAQGSVKVVNASG